MEFSDLHFRGRLSETLQKKERIEIELEEREEKKAAR